MSTKLGNGLRIIGVKTLQDLGAWSEKIAPEIVQAQTGVLDRKLAKLALRYFDADCIGFTRTNQDLSPFAAARKEIAEEISTGYRDSSRNQYDVDFSFCVMPSRSLLLALIFTEFREVRELVEGDPNIREYVYWNNTDAKEGISQRAWKQREIAWDRAFALRDLPVLNGIQFTSDRIPLPDKVRTEYFLGVSERAAEYATTLLTSAYFRAFYIDGKSLIGAIYRESQDYIKGPGRNAFEMLKLGIEKALNPDVKFEDLHAVISEDERAARRLPVISDLPPPIPVGRTAQMLAADPAQ